MSHPGWRVISQSTRICNGSGSRRARRTVGRTARFADAMDRKGGYHSRARRVDSPAAESGRSPGSAVHRVAPVAPEVIFTARRRRVQPHECVDQSLQAGPRLQTLFRRHVAKRLDLGESAFLGGLQARQPLVDRKHRRVFGRHGRRISVGGAPGRHPDHERVRRRAAEARGLARVDRARPAIARLTRHPQVHILVAGADRSARARLRWSRRDRREHLLHAIDALAQTRGGEAAVGVG